MKREEGRVKVSLDGVVHEQARLRILTYLASSPGSETGFTELRDELAFTAGNLSSQLKTLENAGYVRISKRFADNRPFTGVALTSAGSKALDQYLADIESILAAYKKRAD